ncbi:MAG: hypothetical protein OWV35_11715 [Firmicutes bacterium]|nr:hypothetical protein [Bacillota bacterium]
MDGVELVASPGETPEGLWGWFSHPRRGLLSVLVPRTLWRLAGRRDPFTSPPRLLEELGRRALARAAVAGDVSDPVVVTAADLPGGSPFDPAWAAQLHRCPHCGAALPPGEVAEGLQNALAPDEAGETEVRVFCPACRQTGRFRLSPWGLVDGG